VTGTTTGIASTPATHPPIWLLTFFLVLMTLLHVRSFYVPHQERDEVAYMTLAEEMGWDLSNYTTRGDPIVRNYPYSIYRQELFHQPPIYPLMLKVGMAIGRPVVVGLLVQILAMGLLLMVARRAAALFALPVPYQAILYAGLTFCPLLMFSTTRLHHDGLLSIFLFCACVFYIEAANEGSTRKAIVSGLLFVLALNVRYNAIAALPLIAIAQAFHGYRRPGHLRDRATWKCFAVVSVLVLSLGLPHYARVFATYGSLLPSSFITPDIDVQEWNEFLRRVHNRSRLRVFLYLVAIYPVMLSWLLPAQLRSFREKLNERSWEAFIGVASVFLITIHLILLHRQVRYFAVMTPFLITHFVLQLRATPAARMPAMWSLAGMTLILMVTSALAAAIFHPRLSAITPSVAFLLPVLRPFFW
jgi:4-amino-4-deoxy-L-arabinose transferase-like glycosyltransferase